MEVSVLKVREEGIYPVFTPYLAPGPALSTPTYVRICAPPSPRTFLIVPQFHEIAFHLKRSARNRQPSHSLIKARGKQPSHLQKLFGSSQNFYLCA